MSPKCRSKQCPKRYSLPIAVALLGMILAGATLLLQSCEWSASLLCGVLGLTFMALGSILTYLMYRRHSEVEWLQHHGQRLDARVVAINELPTRKPLSKKNYQVVCEACDPHSGRLRKFLSEPLTTRPSCCCGSSKVGVLTDPSNPSLYHVEIN